MSSKSSNPVPANEDGTPSGDLPVSAAERARFKRQNPKVVWLTGLSGSGKSTIAKALERRLFEQGRHTCLLDGDNLRHTLNRDLGFSAADRAENIRRSGAVAKLMAEAGLIVLCAFISPFRADRSLVRSLFAEGDFLEVFVHAPLDLCKARDPKGLYAKVEAGLIADFTGIDSPYEAPEAPDVVLDTGRNDLDSEIDTLVALLKRRGAFG